ncbi:Retrotransposon nucleocapsid protein [Phytophthora megakarya]|uniref:Retrotransposon nucleocapsid protein n=1 Tax=Phytophthora megakarya TaxID=4795 RepID=A0A225V8P5_9STRA|nr:Retrotransposon nucleocapsid protein [Phytophthora megakarya]
MDASDFAVGGVLYQNEVHDGVEIERPVAFAGRKYKPAELNYSIREKELLAILFGLRTWRVYLLDRPFVVETDHRSLETVFKQKSISRRIARWYDELAEYQFQIRYIKGAENSVADGISRRPDFMTSAEPVTLAAISTRQQVRQRVDASLSSTVAGAVRRYDEDDTAKALLRLLDPGYSAKKGESTPLAAPRLTSWLTPIRLITSTELLEHVCEEFHDSPVYGHPGIDRTCRLIDEHYYWPCMFSDITKYVKGCETCARTKARHERPPGLLNSHDIPPLAMDFITGLSTTSRNYDSVMIVIDHLTKRTHLVVGKGTDTAIDMAVRFHKEIFRLAKYRNAKFTSSFWKKLCEMLGVQQKMTTAFRPQGDGISERLRAYSNADSEDWDDHLSLAEFAYNARYQSSISMSPFEADIGYILQTPATIHLPSNVGKTGQPDHFEFIVKQADTLAKGRRSIAVAQDRMAKYYNANRKPHKLNVSDEVFLSDQHISARHLGTTKKKLGARWISPFEITETIGRDYYKLRLHPKLRIH